MEEYWGYVFPEDKEAQPNLKLLERAKLWKKKREEKEREEKGGEAMDVGE